MDLNLINGWLTLSVTGACGVLWWLLRSLHVRVGEHDKALADYKLHVAETYVTSNALSSSIDAINRAIEAIFKKLERIDDKLDNKADK